MRDLRLPDLAEVKTGLDQYIEVRNRAEELNEKIERIEQVVDEIVYNLYGLADDEIDIVESALQAG